MRAAAAVHRALLAGVLAVAASLVPAQQLPFGNVPPGIVAPSLGCRMPGLDPVARNNCFLRDLRYADHNLNFRYQDLQPILKREELRALRDAQRAWLKERDVACGIEKQISDRERWIRYVAEDLSRAECVIRMTEHRTAQLEKMEHAVYAGSVIATITPQAPVTFASSDDPSAAGTKDADRPLQSIHARSQGKHYFEVVIDPARNAQKLESKIVARVNDGQRWLGASYELRPQDIVLNLGPDAGVTIVGGGLGDIRLPKIVIGLAADLDGGSLYWHRNGAWQGKALPGSPHGVPLRGGAEIKAEVHATAALTSLVDQGIVAVNFGDKPFVHDPPVGYVGFDAVVAAEARVAASRSIAVFSPGERVAGTDQVQWVQRYWEWVRSFPGEESPSMDASGHRCAAGQSGPVWFLTGSRESKPFRRACDVPEGKVILVPIVNSLTQVSPGKVASCEQLMTTLKQVSSGVTALRLSLNGTALDKPERYFRTTGCFRLRDASWGQTGLAAGNGYWVFLKPLPKGRYELDFGGTFPTDDFRQDIRYVLQVR